MELTDNNWAPSRKRDNHYICGKCVYTRKKKAIEARGPWYKRICQFKKNNKNTLTQWVYDDFCKENDLTICSICGDPLDGTPSKDIHIDHIVPKSRGGTHELHNLQVVCKTCNSLKSDMTMDEMYAGLEKILTKRKHRYG